MKLVVVLGIFLMPAIACCQKSKTGLGIGDKIPEVELKVWRKGKMETRKLSDYYKDNGMIIDLWATWCSSCIIAMKEVQHEYNMSKSRVNYLPVTYEDSTSVIKFIRENNVLKSIKFDFATNDSLLAGHYFKFTKIPQAVWVDRQGFVRGITYPDQLTAANLIAFERGYPLVLDLKKERLDFNLGDTLDMNNMFIYRSVLTKARPELPNWRGDLSRSIDKTEKCYFFQALNSSILSLFYSAFNNGSGRPVEWSRIELHVKDTQKIFPDFANAMNIGAKIREFTYCYELILPRKVSRTEFGRYLMEDLNRVFNYRAEVQKRRRKCWVLTLIDSTLLNAHKPADAQMKVVFENHFPKSATNITTGELTVYLDATLDSLRVINETGVENSFNFFFWSNLKKEDSKYLDQVAVKACLRSQGLDLIKEEREVDILVVTEK